MKKNVSVHHTGEIQFSLMKKYVLVHNTRGIQLTMMKKYEILHNTGGIRACTPHWRNTIKTGGKYVLVHHTGSQFVIRAQIAGYA